MKKWCNAQDSSYPAARRRPSDESQAQNVFRGPIFDRINW